MLCSGIRLQEQGQGVEVVRGLTAAAQLIVWHTEHCTWLAPRGYISTTRQFWFVHTSCAISPPAQGHRVLSACEAKR